MIRLLGAHRRHRRDALDREIRMIEEIQERAGKV
jgi:hypothetical protein